MPGAIAMKLDATVRSPDGLTPIFREHAVGVTEWVGPYTVQVADGVSEQSIVAMLTQGLTTVTALVIGSDRAISVTYGNAGNNEGTPLAANGFHAMIGTSLGALSITNNSGATANVSILVGGS